MKSTLPACYVCEHSLPNDENHSYPKDCTFLETIEYMFLEQHPSHQEAPRRSVYKVCRGCSGDISHLSSVLESIRDGERTLTRYPGFLQLLRDSFAGTEKEPSKEELTSKPIKKVEKASSSAKEEWKSKPRKSKDRCLIRMGECQQQEIMSDCPVCEKPIEKETLVKKIGRDLQFYQHLKGNLHKDKRESSVSQIGASDEACHTCQKHVAMLKEKKMEGPSADVEPPAKKRRTTV